MGRILCFFGMHRWGWVSQVSFLSIDPSYPGYTRLKGQCLRPCCRARRYGWRRGDIFNLRDLDTTPFAVSKDRSVWNANPNSMDLAKWRFSR